VKHIARLWISAACLTFLFGGTRTFAWGPEGHKVVALMAEKNMSSTALEKVEGILSGSSLENVANWADEIRPERAETGSWHYINIPLAASSINRSRDCPSGNCITAQIQRFIAVLRGSGTDSKAKQEALKFVVHFVGDLHQPLHTEDDQDRGGNQRTVSFFGQIENLHEVWDSSILSRDDPSPQSLAEKLEGKISASNKSDWSLGTVDGWALESHKIAQQTAYGDLPNGLTPGLGQRYEDASAPAEETQLERAGIRLASILNEVLR
jgi:hypothetical protein